MTTPNHPSPPSPEIRGKDYYQVGMAEDDHLLYQDDTSKDSASLSYGPRKSIGLAALLPLATVLFWSFGMGSSLFIWLLARRITSVPGSLPGSFKGYIVVDEGNKTGSTQMLDGQEELESNLRGVLIITAISHFSSMAVVPLMALGAFYVAAQWLNDQANSKNGPTPLQFGLIMQMCSSGTWDSVLLTLKYLIRHRKTKATTHTWVSPLVYRALTISGLVVFLHYAVIATDLWLTAEIGSLYYSRALTVDVTSSAEASVLGTQQNTSVSIGAYGAAFSYIGRMGTTKSSGPEYSRDNRALLYRGMDVMNGLSNKNHIGVINFSNISSPQDVSSMAVITRPPFTVPPQWSWTASTIGMTTRCQPAPCKPEKDRVVCPTSTGMYPSIPLPSFPYVPSNHSERFNNVISYNPTTGQAIPNAFNWTTGQVSNLQTNPSYVVIQLHLDGSTTPTNDGSELGLIGLSRGTGFLFYYGICEITMYDVELSFTGSPSTGNTNGNRDPNSQYSLSSPPVPISDDRTTLLFGPVITDFSYFIHSPLNYSVMSALERNVVTAMVNPRFSYNVSAEFARLTLGLISSMTEPIPAKAVINNSPKLVSRYPMAGTLSYIAVVYAHGVLAIILFVGIIGKSSNSVVVNEPGWQLNWRGLPVRAKQKPVQELLLVHSRLTDPLAMVAEHFSEDNLDNKEGSEKKWDEPSSDIYTSVGALSARRDPIEMFGVESVDSMRIEVGLIDDREGGRRFGLNHRRGRLVQGPSNTDR